MPHHKCDESRLDPDTAWSFVLSGDDAGLIINWGESITLQVLGYNSYNDHS